jgi:transposase-like protein
MCATGGAASTLRKWVQIWQVSVDHFDPYWAARNRVGRTIRPIEEILIEHSTYPRGALKRRLYQEGLKREQCELCGQGGTWRGRRMALILDHVNGVATDNRLENLRIVCPNCAATLDTHCGRNKELRQDRACIRCGVLFSPRYVEQRHCSSGCGSRHDRSHLRGPRPHTRKVERPSYEQLREDLGHLSYVAVGRKYGVSDKAVRKWLRWYEHDRTAGPDHKAAPARRDRSRPSEVRSGFDG